MRVQKMNGQTQRFESVGVESKWLRIETRSTTFDLEETEAGTLRVRTIGGWMTLYPEVANSIVIALGVE